MRKIISLMLSLILVISLAVPALAATVKQEASSTAIQAGEEVKVTVSLDEDVADIVMYQYSLYYNKDLFTMTGSTGSAVVSNPLSDEDGDYFMISFVDTTSEGVTISAGTLAELTFRAKEDMTQEQAASFVLRQDYFWDTGYADIDGIGLENGTVSVTVSPAAPEVQQYTVTLPENPVGYTVTPTEGSVSPVDAGGSYSFTVTVDTENYEGDPVVKANGLSLTVTEGVYTIYNIQEDQTVTVEGIKEQGLAADKVIYQNGSHGQQWPYGVPVFINSLTLKGLAVTDVSWDAAYENCTVTLHKKTSDNASFSLAAMVQVNGQQQMLGMFSATVNGQNFTGGTFTYSGNLENGKAEIEVTAKAQNYSGTKTIYLVVDGASQPEPETHEVTLTEGAGYTIAAAEGSVSPVVEGGSFSFTVTVNEGYEGTPVVKAGETELTAVEGVYTIENITADQVVTVEGITQAVMTYTVTLTEGAGYTVTAAEGSVSPVVEGGSFSFTVTVSEGYEGTPVVKVGETELTAVEGVYTIENITADLVVTVEGIALKPHTYEVTLTEGAGYTIAAAQGSTSPVTEGGSFSFTVSVNSGYEGSVAVKANGSELTAVDGIYTIENITENQTVTVEGIAPKDNTYTVSAAKDVTASKGSETKVLVNVTGNSDAAVESYNDYDVTVSYDKAGLTYVSAAAAHDGAEITADPDAGTVRIVGHGDARAFTDALVTLTFQAEDYGSYDVTIVTAKVDNSGNAIALDAPEAAVSDKTTAVKVGYPVELPENFAGEKAVLPGGDYRFTAPNPYYDITVTVGGNEVEYTVDGLTYTIYDVNGEVVITAVGKIYQVTKSGEHVTFREGADTAQYGEDYSFKVEPDAGYAIDDVKILIGDAEVEYTISDGIYTVSGGDIIGDMDITVTVLQGKTQITFEGVDPGEVVGGLNHTADNGEDYDFQLNEAEGYSYTVRLEETELKPDNAGVYTIPGEKIDGTPLTVKITKTKVEDPGPGPGEPTVTVEVSQYINLGKTVMWLVTATDAEENILAYGEEGTMFWSDAYNAYCWLVISAESEDAVKQAAELAVVAVDVSSQKCVNYDHDVNLTHAVDINDAQLTYDMYQAKLYTDFEKVTMDKFLEADLNGDGCVNVEDAAAVVAYILNQ